MTIARRTLLVAAAAMLAGTGLTSAPALAAESPTLVVTELPAQVRLIPGESIVLALSTNRTTGYSWSTKVTGNKKAVKVYQGAYSAPASADGMVGVPGTTRWAIDAKKVGTAKISVIATSPGGEASTDGVLTVIVMKAQ